VNIRHRQRSSEALAAFLRAGSPRVFGRVHRDTIWLDMRSLSPADDQLLILALRRLWELDGGTDSRTTEL